MTVSRQHSTRSQEGAIGIQRQMGSSQLNALAIRWRLRKIIEKNFLSPALLEKKREKTISLGARDFCRQRATRCENVTQYYQAADTMIGCLLVRDCIVGCMQIRAPKTTAYYTANILTVLCTAFGSVTCATLIWLHILQPKIAIDFKLYSSGSLNVICTDVDRKNHC